MSQFPGSHTASSGTGARNAVSFDSDSTAGAVHAPTGYLAKRQNTQIAGATNSRELLSNTETLALESFLDSIANEGMVSKAKDRAAKDREAADNKKKRKIKALLGQEGGTSDEDVSRSNTSSGGSTKKRNIPAKASAGSPSAPVSESNAAETAEAPRYDQEGIRLPTRAHQELPVRSRRQNAARAAGQEKKKEEKRQWQTDEKVRSTE
ncbi:hypothetical protein PMKS-003385 [Pichia membranifaciens]|uniref:Uncharacterized protein n=1 Tax=Pichia membranifaciens TaxID=4926 RepID=A0A1Q2YK10_9ASCO|nr:hypothetical protein PMKS-003385 [Pichia membranifaciens]